MLARLHSVTLESIEGIICEVEVDIGRDGFDKSVIVGTGFCISKQYNR
ncbi:MAG: hypothetical protein JW715_13600 [Sedimentisphaerales bacterium]|nr:hypothetical protein [Sedimentisphaerales bacterium]